MKKGFRFIALLAALALVAAACGDDTSDTTAATVAATTTTADAGGGDTTTTTEDMMTGPIFDIGVTEAPCTNGSPDRGCIQLGSVTDQTATFAAASPGLLAGHQLFWARGERVRRNRRLVRR